MSYLDPYKALEWYKKKNPYRAKYRSDFELYEELKAKYPQFEYDENPFVKKSPKDKPPKNWDTMKEDAPGFIEGIATANIAELFAGDSDMAKRAYNNSIAGTIYQIKNGKMKYDVDMTSSGWQEDVGQFFLGLMSPLDIGLFALSGGIGGIAAKSFFGKAATTAGAKLLNKKLTNEVSKQAAKTALKQGVNKSAVNIFTSKGALESGVSLATFGAAGGGLANAAEQSIRIQNGEQESFNHGEYLWTGAKHGITSGMLGAAGGALTKGVMMPKLAKIKSIKDKTFMDRAAQLMYGPAGQVGAEGAVFSGGQLLEMAAMGHDIDMDTVYSTFMTNLGIIGGLKTTTKVLMKSKPAIDEYNKFKRNLYKETLIKEKFVNRVLGDKLNKKKNLVELNNDAMREENWDLSNKLKKEIDKIDVEIAGQVEAAEIFGSKFKEYKQLVDKFNEKGVSELSANEQRLLIQGDRAMNLLTINALKEMRDNSALGEKIIGKDLYPNVKTDKLSDKQKKFIKDNIESRIKELEEVGRIMNETSIVGNNADMQREYAKRFNFDVVENSKKPGTYDVVVEAPNGKRVMDYPFLKGLDKKQANNIKKGLLKDIEDVVVGEKNQIKASKNPDSVKRTYKFVDINTGQIKPYLVGAGGVEINTKRMTPKEAAEWNAKMGKKGQFVPAEKDGIPLNNPKESGNKTVNLAEQGISDWISQRDWMSKQFESFKPVKTGEMPITIEAYNIKATKFTDFITKSLNELDPELRNFRQQVFDKGETKHLVNTLRQLENGEVALLAAFDMVNLKNEKSILKNTQLAIKIATYLALNNKDVHNITGRNLANLIAEGVPEFTIKIIDNRKNSKTKGQIIDKKIASTKIHQNFTALSSLRQFIKALRDGDFITGDRKNLLLGTVEGFHKVANELRGANIKDAKTGVRNEILKIGKDLSSKRYFPNSNVLDKGYDIAAQLAGKYYFRGEEINKFTPKNIKEVLLKDAETGEWYLDIGADIKKYKTKRRIVWIDKNLATELQTYKGNLSNGKYVTEVTKLIKKSGNLKDKLTDSRRRGQTIGNRTLDGPEYRRLNYLLGHERTTIQEIYAVDKISDILKDQMNLHSKLGSPIPQVVGSSSKIDFLKLDRKMRPAAKEVHQARLELFKERYPELSIRLVDKFANEGIPSEVAGYLQDNVARILLNKAPSYAIPHEVGHHVFGILRAFRDVAKEKGMPSKLNTRAYKESIKLLEQAEKIFVKDGKFSEEYAVSTIDKVIDKMIDAPTMSKVQGWFKRFNRFVKRIFNKDLSKEEISWALGEKILSRKGIPVMSGQVGGRKYLKLKDFASPQDFVNSINRDVATVAEQFKFSKDEIQGLISLVATDAGIENPSKFRIKLGIEPTLGEINNLELFQSKLKELNLNQITKKRDTLAFLKMYREAEDKRIYKKNITTEKEIEILKHLGVKDGDIKKSSIEQLKKYNEYLDSLDDIKNNHVEWTNSKEMADFMSNESKGAMAKLGNEFMVVAGPVHETIANFGLKSLADKMRTHNAVMEGHIGDWIIFEHRARNAVGSKAFDGTLRYRGIKDHLWALDNKGEMLLEDLKWINKVGLKEKRRIKEAEKFFRKAISDSWWNTINKKGTKGANLKEHLRKEKGNYTPEAEVVRAHIDLMKGYADKLPRIVGTKLGEAETQAWIKNNNINMVKDGIYMTRALTKEGKLALDIDRKSVEKTINSLIDDIAHKEAVKKYGENYTNEQLLKVDKDGFTLRDYARGVAFNEYHNMTTFSPSRFGTRYLKARHLKQDNYIYDSNKKKYVRVYERDYTKLTKSYVYGMSRFFANLQIFPELVSLDGFRYPGVKEQIAQLTSLRGQSATRGQWVLDRLEKQVGLGKYDAPIEIAFELGESAAKTTAKLGLSFPTAGLKNILTGTTQTLWAFDMVDVARGFADVIKQDTRKFNEVKRSGAPETGMAIWEGGFGEKILDNISFKYGLMKPSEKFNRYLVVLASKREQAKLLRNLKEYPEGHSLNKKATERLRTFYQMNEKDIGMLRKYGTVEGVKDANFKSSFKKMQMIEEMRIVEQKLNSAAHINTQGSSVDIFMPAWWGERGWRPLTLFKRMAYAATVNTLRSVKSAKREGGTAYLRPLMGMLATYGSGQLLIGTYSTLLGRDMPKENSPWWERFMTTMWQGEFLGLLSGFMSPYDDSISDSIHPAMYETIWSAITQIREVSEGKAFVWERGGAVDTWVKGNWQIYNNTMKAYEKINKPFYNRSTQFGKLYNDFEKEVYDTPDMEFEKTTRTPYYKALREVFYKGTSEQFARQYFETQLGVATDFLRTHKAFSVDEALEMAYKEVKKQLKAMNPNRGTFSKSTKDKRKPILWLNWLKKHPRANELIPELHKLEVEYVKKLKKYKSEMPYHSRKLNLSDMFNQFDWEIPPL